MFELGKSYLYKNDRVGRVVSIDPLVTTIADEPHETSNYLVNHNNYGEATSEHYGFNLTQAPAYDTGDVVYAWNTGDPFPIIGVYQSHQRDGRHVVEIDDSYTNVYSHVEVVKVDKLSPRIQSYIKHAQGE